MRTGGDDVAAGAGADRRAPVVGGDSGRVTGFAIMPLAELKRPRVDVTFRVSGLFRDAFPTQIELSSGAVNAIARSMSRKRLIRSPPA